MDDKCYKDKNIQLIKLTTFREGFFTCNDGVCIPMSKMCDQTAHCQDESDEKDFKLVVMKKNYNKNIAPFTVNPANEKIESVQVNISTKVIDILNLNKVQQSFEVKFGILLSWYDYRLVYHNLKTSRIANRPTVHEKDKLWIPNIVFDNTKFNDVITND